MLRLARPLQRTLARPLQLTFARHLVTRPSRQERRQHLQRAVPASADEVESPWERFDAIAFTRMYASFPRSTSCVHPPPPRPSAPLGAAALVEALSVLSVGLSRASPRERSAAARVARVTG